MAKTVVLTEVEITEINLNFSEKQTIPSRSLQPSAAPHTSVCFVFLLVRMWASLFENICFGPAEMVTKTFGVSLCPVF